MNLVFENLLTRRSIRSFTSQPISHSDLEQIVTAGTFAPSGMNQQSWQFTVLSNTEQITSLANAVGKALGNSRYNFYQPAALVLVSNQKDNHNGLADCACALENMFLAAHSLGIGSCWINQLKDVDNDPEVRDLLNKFGVPHDHIVWGSAALGYASTPVPAKPRKEGTVIWVK